MKNNVAKMIPYFSIIEINIGGITLQAWGSCVAAGIIAAVAISLKKAKERNISKNLILDIILLAFLGMAVGGRLFFILFNLGKNPDIFNVHSGFSLIGGVFVIGIFSLLYLKKTKIDYRKIFDMLAPSLITALIFTRIGCFLIGDHVGKKTSLPWGREFIDGSIRHPIALYHIFFLFLILIIIQKSEKNIRQKGVLFAITCFLYAWFRFISDFFRCDDLEVCDLHWNGLTATQWILLACIVVANMFFISRKIKSKNSPK